ncbi:MAG: hypothetical protein KC620_21055, partial [Myxococcales bacterium]|nr:hypothetical protein [Myxococcales bacterium]
MSGAAYLERARQASDPADADRLAALAIVVEPDLTDAYALRARLAALRGDAVVAAHYFRAAYARGDRSPPTRACLAICL